MARFLTSLVTAAVLAAPVHGATLCSLPHHPVAAGDVSEYRTTTRTLDAAGDVVRTKSTVHKETVDSVGRDRYVTTTVKLGESAKSVRICTKEGIRPELPQHPRVTVVTTGVSIPARLREGDSWTLTHESRSDAGMTSVATVSRVAGQEDVTVPAGTFRAFRVDHEIRIAAPGREPAVTTRGSKWFATGVGLVRTMSTVDSTDGAEAQKVEVTVELLKRTTK